MKKVLAWPAYKNKIQNPYNTLLYEQIAAEGNWSVEEFIPRPGIMSGLPDIFHIHWPEEVIWNRFSNMSILFLRFYTSYILSLMKKVRASGGAVVWTLHNLEPHEAYSGKRGEIWSEFFGEFKKNVDLVLSLSEEAKRLGQGFHSELETLPFAITPLPHFRSSYPSAISRNDAKEKLGIDDGSFLISVIGQIRKYKGVLEIARCFQKAAKSDEYLYIAGSCVDEEDSMILDELSASCDNIRFYNKHLDLPEMRDAVCASNVCFFNYKKILNSASVLLSLSYDRPYISPKLGSIPEVSSLVGSDWATMFEGNLTSEILRNCLDNVRETSVSGEAPIDQFSPEVVARLTVAAYESVLSEKS